MLLNLNRPNIRGIKKCRFCGYYNGNRSKSCKNQNCPQFLECARSINKRQSKLTLESSVDPITINTGDEVQYYSVRVSAGNCENSRNFVKIEESTIETDRNTVIICRTAVCYVDSCMKSVTNVANCRHIAECSNQSPKPKAKEMPVSQTKFLKFFSHLTEPERSDLWDYYYSTCSSTAVQQLRDNVFAVKAIPIPCGSDKENSREPNFPTTTGTNDFVHCELGQNFGGGPTFHCSCRGASPNNNLCQHILLLYSAIDGNCNLRNHFKMHLDVACKELDLHELDLLDLDWDLRADAYIDHMINEEFLMDQTLELEFNGDFEDILQAAEEILQNPSESQKKDAGQRRDEDKMSLSVSFDSILTSIIERMNCSFSSGGNDTSAQEFIFCVHNDFFSCLSERFSENPRFFPCETKYHSSGAYMGLSTQLYRFYDTATLSRIFTSKSATLILEQIFCNYHNGVQPMDDFVGHPSLLPDPCQRTTVIKESTLREGGVGGEVSPTDDNCVRIAWTADTLPTSSHGELKISFRYDFVSE